MNTFQINETNLAPTIDDLKTIYLSMLLEPSSGLLERQNTHYHIKRSYELAAERDLQNLWAQSLEKAYQTFFDKHPQYAKISAHYKFFYCPSKNLLEGKYRYTLGADPHLYGWNLVGKVLEKHFYGWKPKFNKYWVYQVYHALNYLYAFLIKGEDISIYNGLTPVDILKKMERLDEIMSNLDSIDSIYRKFHNRELEHYDLYINEFNYPKNLAMFVQRQYAPFVNHIYDNSIKTRLISKILSLLEKQTQKQMSYITPKAEWGDKLLELYAAHKLPLSQNSLLEIKSMIGQMWSDKKVVTTLSSLPNSSWACTNIIQAQEETRFLVLSENNEPISPLFPSELVYKDNKFTSVLHLTYFLMFVGLGVNSKDAYDKIYQVGQGFIDFSKCDVDFQIDYCLLRRGKEHIVKWIRKKCEDPNYKKSLILTNGFPKLQYNSTHDLFLGVTEKTNFLGDYLVMFRNHLQQKQPGMFKSYILLSKISQDIKTMEILERYYLHITRTFEIAYADLGFKKDLKSFRNIVKMVHPSFYVLYKKNTQKTAYPDAIFNDNWDKECNEFLYHILESIALFSQQSSGYGSKPKEYIDTVKKVELLYQHIPIKNFALIEKLLCGESTHDDESEPVPKSLDKLIDKKIDKQTRTELAQLVIKLHKNRSFQQY